MSKRLLKKHAMRHRRHRRVRKRVFGTSERPRLCVYRSNRHFYVQVIDDVRGHTLASASTRSAEAATGHDIAAASAVGAVIAERAKSVGVSQVVFDRGGAKYHGRIAAVADAAREAGLEF